MGKLACVVAALGVVWTPRSAPAGEAGFSAERWRFRAATARVEEKLGREGLLLKDGHAYLNDVAFADGTVEADVAVPNARTFVGLVFRVVSDGNQEKVYLRPHKSGLDDAVQYEAVFDGSTTWQIYSAPDHMAGAVVPKERWFRLKIVFSGLQATVFVEDLEKPALVVPRLKREAASGGLGLWAGGGGAWFSGIRFEPAASPPAVAAAPAAPLPPGVIRNWELSPALDAEDALPEAVPVVARWDRVPVESPGVLVIDRYRKSAGVLPPAFDFKNRLGKAKGRRVVYARAVVDSSGEQVKRLSFGYSDEVCVFLNGRIVFSGRSAFRFRDPGFMGVVDVENDAVYLPLRPGKNEIVMAVAEYFGGWGLIARFDDPSGLVLP